MKTKALLLGALALGACSSSHPVETSAISSNAAFDALPAEAQARVRGANVPVLLLPPRYASEAQAVAGPTFLSFHAPDGDTTVILEATNVVHHDLGGEAAPSEHRVRGVAAQTSINEGIRYVTWSVPGAFYRLEVECHSMPLEDSRCARSGFVLDLAEELVQWSNP